MASEHHHHHHQQQEQQQQQEGGGGGGHHSPHTGSGVLDVLSDSSVRTLFSKLVQCAGAANSLPQEREHRYYRTLSPQFGQIVSKQASILLSHVSSIQIMHRPQDNLVNDLDDLDEQYESCVDLLDSLLENVDTALDEIHSHHHHHHRQQQHHHHKNMVVAMETKEKGRAASSTTTTSSSSSDGGVASADSLRPQSRWRDVDNSGAPFVPRLTSKPNAQVPLDRSLDRTGRMMEGEGGEGASQTGGRTLFEEAMSFRYTPGMGVGGPVQRDSYPHPYEPELRALEFPRALFQPRPEQLFRGLGDTPCTWVDTEAALQELAAQLECEQEFAVDLEHHSYRTFQGFTCLMQISTRTQDYLIDVLELRESMQILNTSFTNPRIVKVLHGADSDILWLQRDCGLYIVNLFDTGLACRVLEKPRASLAYLLKFYCDVDADKKYQLADWRVRPLPSEMVKYARQDTHYLLYIYDRLRNEILGENSRGGMSGADRMRHVLEQSRQLCLRRYEKERFDEMAYLQVLNKFDARFTREQTEAFRALYKWRDAVARREDESVRFVMPNHMMVAIAEAMPTTAQKLIGTCNPVPRLVRKHAVQLLKIIEHAAQGGQVSDDLIITRGKWSTLHSETAAHQVQQQQQHLVMSTPRHKSGPSRHTDTSHLETPTSSTISPITAMMDRMRYTESPVMTTDQLFGKAGWVEDALPAVAPVVKPLTFSFDEREFSGVSDSINGSGSGVGPHAMSANASEFVPSSRRQQTANGFGADSGGAQVALAERSSIFGTIAAPSTSLGSLPPGLSKVSRINESFTFASLQSPMKRPRLTQPSQQRQQQQQQEQQHNDDDMDIEDNHDGAVMIHPPSTPVSQLRLPAEDADEPVTPPDERVPMSLSEIYKISKKNRKRNKKLAVKHVGGIRNGNNNNNDGGGGGGGDRSRSGNARKGSGDRTKRHSSRKVDHGISRSGGSSVSNVDEHSFMRKIGWI